MKVSEKRQRVIDDQSLYGDSQTGEFKGVRWEASRCYGGILPTPKRWNMKTAPIHHWCAYICVPDYDDALQDHYLKCFVRSECTYQNGSTLGFDCGHSHDVSVYREFPYVLSIIQNTIDNLIKLASQKKNK